MVKTLKKLRPRLVDIDSAAFEQRVLGIIVQASKETKPAISKLANHRFEKLADGWIKDKDLNIEWGPSSPASMNFKAAEKYCAKHAARLPTLKELQSLVDYEKYHPAVDKEFFGDTKSAWYWTSLPVAGSPGYVWVIEFYCGYVDDGHQVNAYYVRPVRSSQ